MENKKENFSKKTQLFNEGSKEINDMKNAVLKNTIEYARGNEKLKQGKMVKEENMWGLLRALKYACSTSPARFSLIGITKAYGFKDSRLLKFLRDFNVVRLVANGNDKAPCKYSWNIEIDRPFNDIVSATEQGWKDYKYNLSNLAKKQGKRVIKLLQPIRFEDQSKVEDNRFDSAIKEMNDFVEKMNEDEFKIVAKTLSNDYAKLLKSIEVNKESKKNRFAQMIKQFKDLHSHLDMAIIRTNSSVNHLEDINLTTRRTLACVSKLERVLENNLVVETRFFFGLIKIKSTIKVAK